MTQFAPQFLEEIKNYLLMLQEKICHALELEEEKEKFQEDLWSNSPTRYGRTRVLRNGKVFEQAGVNFSSVQGDVLPAAATEKRPELIGCRFHAMGVSIVIHPLNPYVPTTHFNVRFFLAEKENMEPVWWFGGGYDLTPYYGFDEDCQHFHETAKLACDSIDPHLYAGFKKWADDYFYLPHRKEQRGVGGIFFDDLNKLGFLKCFNLIKTIGMSFVDAYLPIVSRRKNIPYGKEEVEFQHYRRGRYVEFNLIYDRGTLFGLQTNGRTESILMSLPPKVSWRYNWVPESGSKEEKLYTHYLVPKNWIRRCYDSEE